MGAAILGMQATVGLLVAKALTTSATPYYPPGSTPVLALDVFLVQVYLFKQLIQTHIYITSIPSFCLFFFFVCFFSFCRFNNFKTTIRIIL